MSVHIIVESFRRSTPERVEILSISTIVDRDGYPMFAGTIDRIGIGNEQFRTVVSR